MIIIPADVVNEGNNSLPPISSFQYINRTVLDRGQQESIIIMDATIFSLFSK